MKFAANPVEIDLELLIHRHQAGVWRYLRVLGCEPSRADDLTQEVFLVLLRQPFVERHEAATWSFLRRTARHLFLRSVTAAAKAREELRADLVDELWTDMPDETGAGYVDALRACVAELEGRSRLVIRRFYEDGESRAKIAADLGMKEAGVKTLLQRTRAVLRACLDRRMR